MKGQLIMGLLLLVLAVVMAVLGEWLVAACNVVWAVVAVMNYVTLVQKDQLIQRLMAWNDALDAQIKMLKREE